MGARVWVLSPPKTLFDGVLLTTLLPPLFLGLMKLQATSNEG